MTEAVVRKTLLDLAAERKSGATYCPSEAAKRLASDWRPLMQRVRQVAATLVNQGRLVCTQRGRTVHPLEAKGAIRLAAGDSHGGH